MPSSESSDVGSRVIGVANTPEPWIGRGWCYRSSAGRRRCFGSPSGVPPNRRSVPLSWRNRPGPGPLPWPCEQPASGRWGGAQASRRPAQGADRQPDRTRCLEGHHASGPKRVHLLGRGCKAGDDSRTPHSPDPGGAGGRPASALLLARVQAPRAHRQIATSLRRIPNVPSCASDKRHGPGTARERVPSDAIRSNGPSFCAPNVGVWVGPPTPEVTGPMRVRRGRA